MKLDEDLSPLVGEPLTAKGYEVRTVVEQRWSGIPDEEIAAKVKEAGEFLVTADKGFGDVRLHPPGTHPGILVLRPDRESIASYRELLVETIAQSPLESLVSCVSVASKSGLRVRRP